MEPIIKQYVEYVQIGKSFTAPDQQNALIEQFVTDIEVIKQYADNPMKTALTKDQGYTTKN